MAYEKMRKHTVEMDRLQMTIQWMCNACWIPKAINTHSEHVTLIGFPLQQWLYERISLLHLYIHCPLLVYFTVNVYYLCNPL